MKIEDVDCDVCQEYVYKPQTNTETGHRPEADRPSFDDIYFADYESFVRDAAGDFIQHNPSMLCYNSLSDREVKTVFCIENIFDEILRKK